MKTTVFNIKELKTAIERQIRHPYLSKFITNPVISEDKLVLLSMIVNDTHLSEEKQKQYILTTMLVQVALDTHELVTLNEDNEEDSTTKNRQLIVLAGDYYSGLYYYLLSNLDDIPMIRVLASAIKEINEYKIQIYNQDISSVQQLMECVQQVESLLIQRVAEFLNLSHFKGVAADLLLVKKLQTDKERYHQREVAPVIDILMKSSLLHQNAGQRFRLIEDTIQKQYVHAENSLAQLPTRFGSLKDYLQSRLYHSLYLKQKVVEEG